MTLFPSTVRTEPEAAKPLHVRLDRERMIIAYWDGEEITGYCQQVLVYGIGWVVADDENWSEEEIRTAIHRHLTGE